MPKRKEPKQKKKLTPAQKRERKKRREEYMTIFLHGKQVRVRRPPTIDGMSVDEFIRRNADPIWPMQNEYWEYLPESEAAIPMAPRERPSDGQNTGERDDDIPF